MWNKTLSLESIYSRHIKTVNNERFQKRNKRNFCIKSEAFFYRFQLVKNTVQCFQVPSENTTIGKGNQACVFHMCVHTHQK